MNNKFESYIAMSEEEFLSKIDEVSNDIESTLESYINGSSDSDIPDITWDAVYIRLSKYKDVNTEVSTNADTPHFMSDIGGITIKIQTDEDLINFCKTMEKEGIRALIASPKFDGMSVFLHVIDGKINKALTRGKDGKGVDITNVMVGVIDVPALNEFSTCNEYYLRAEIVMDDIGFNKYKELTGKEYVDKRSSVAGLVRSQSFKDKVDKELVECLKIVPFFFEESEGTCDILTKYLTLSKLVPDFKLELSMDLVGISLFDCLKEIKDRFIPVRNSSSIDLDGVVIYLIKDGDPVRIAYKFDPFSSTTKVLDIEWDFSPTSGVYTPVAIIDVVFQGKEFKRVSLANAGRVIRERFEIGDNVLFEYRSDVMGYLNQAEDTSNKNHHPIPTNCSHCNSELVLKENLKTQGEYTFLVCENSDCDGKLIGKFLNFLDKIGVKGIQEKTLRRIEDYISDFTIEGMYSKINKEFLIGEAGFGEIEASVFVETIDSIRSTKIMDFELLGSLNIPLVSRGRCSTILEELDLSSLVVRAINAKTEEVFIKNMPKIAGIGGSVLSALYHGIRENESDIHFLMHDLIPHFTSSKAEMANVTENTNIKDKVFVITGDLYEYINRDELVTIIKKHGGKVVGSVSGKTDYLINNDIESLTSKNKKAKELNVPIITEQQFKLMF